MKTLGIDAMLYESALTRPVGVALIVAGFVLLLGFIYLGQSVSVGLPEEKTELKT